MLLASMALSGMLLASGDIRPFDGTTLTEWSGDQAHWLVENGELVGRTTAENPLAKSTYLVWKGDMPRDFDLRCKVRISGAGANSGIHYRSRPVQGQTDLAGFQADLDAEDRYTGVLYEGLGRELMSARGEQVEWTPQGKRVLAQRAPDAILRKAIKHDDWNEFRISAEGTRVRHWINGVLMTDVTDGDATRFKGDGALALQLHAGGPMEVRFKDIVVTPLTKAPPPESIAVPEGFRVELLASAQPDQGSWVCLTFDPLGRAVISPKQGPLLRAAIPGVSKNADGTHLLDGGIVVEPAGIPAGSAQGLCFVGNDLYLNGALADGPQISMWRLRDGDGDGTWETQTQMVRYEGDGGEHGPHAIVRGPDGALYVAIGNHTHLPRSLVMPATDKEPGTAPDSPYTNFGEDFILPRMWDASGHAVGIYAPGGVVLRVDPASGATTVMAGGFRNAYDHCFNADGELITYDSDMEWDMGAPWYRAPRVVHVVQGGEYGWRSGSSCWPEWFQDSLPPACETDSASPTGMLSGHESAWPEPYRSMVYCGDWTFGRILGVTLSPTGSSYTGSWQPWATGRPMPVADMAWGPDGQMYIVTGGRNTQSGLYRISYAGAPATAAPATAAPATAVPASTLDLNASQRQIRQRLERLQHNMRWEELEPAVPFIIGALESADRFIQQAACAVLEQQVSPVWREAIVPQLTPPGVIAASLVLAKSGDEVNVLYACERATEVLEMFLAGNATRAEALGAIRVLQVALARNPQIRQSPTGQALAEQCFNAAILPQGELIEDPLVWEGLSLACAMDVGAAVPVAVARLQRAVDRTSALRYATMLRAAKSGWTDELRAAYWAWLNAADARDGGFSLRGFIEEIKRQASANVGRPANAAAPEAQGSGGGAQPVPPPTPVATSASVHIWTVDELVEEDPAAVRDMARGARMYRETLCIQCHRFNGEGASTGPDLTGVGARFTREDLLKAILQPSATVSDQYRDTAIETKDGDIIVGRIVGDSAEAVDVRTNPLTDERQRVPKSQISGMAPVETSSMPSGLLSARTREEVLDLLAYLQRQSTPR